MTRLASIVLLALTALQTASLAKDNAQAACPVVKIEAVRLPDLNMPRSGHSVFVVNGEPTVVGGHTTSFVPTATAEYFRDGKWHLIETAYPHDEGFCVPLSSGKVLVGGGHAEPLGIGHIYSVEMYDPASHTVKGFGCLDTKRSFASGAEIDSGRVVISGNWYQNIDDIEVFDGRKYFHSVKKTAQKRSRPHVMRIANDDVIIFSRTDERANFIDTIIVDRLKGEPFQVPLFEEWKPLASLVETDSRNCRVEDEGQDSYTYLIPVENREGQVAICRIAGTDFSLLPTESRIPMTCEGRRINYQAWLCIDRRAGRAYIYGNDSNNGKRLYVLAIDITKTPASLTLFYTDPTDHPVYGFPVLTTDGSLLLAGGMELNADGTVDNFTPHATVLLLPLGQKADQLAGTKARTYTWLWILLPLLVLLAMAVLLWQRKKAKAEEETGTGIPINNTDTDEALMQRICQLMDKEQPFLNSELKIADIASQLGTNVSYVSACINRQKGCSFNQFVNGYRINYAKAMLRHKPEKKLSEVWTASGFANETTFFRTFKTITGMTPTDWKAQID
ncbi:MAG: helix-turn-helix domain-containing protein [Bacteroidaceae bacterium]|nr:helix-turn-helix domain-containing protein [Bacteroidaceae bacterium]